MFNVRKGIYMFSKNLKVLIYAMALTAGAFVVGCEEEKESVTQTETKAAAPVVEKKAEAPKPAVKPTAAPKAAPASTGPTLVKMQTSKGDIVIELNAEKAPITAKNFVDYVNEGHYSGKIFHRVIKGFMIQGGNFDVNMKRAATKAQIVNEASNGLRNVRGTIAMARTSNPNSATDQFYINHGNNASLDYATRPPGYAVFGKVIEGMETVDAIASVQTGPRDVPVTPVIITSAKVITK